MISTEKLSSQEQTTVFDSIYMHTATITATLDLNKAIITADSLVEYSANRNQKMRSLMLLAMLHDGKGSFVEAIRNATESEKIAIADADYEWQVRSSGFLATAYRRVDLISEARKHIEIANLANKERKDAANYHSIQSIVHHEKSMHHMDASDFSAALEELKKAEENLNKSPDSPMKQWSLATIYESYAQIYLKLDEYKKAHESLTKAFDIIGEHESKLSGLLYRMLGEIEMHNQNFETAHEHFIKAEKYAEQYDNFILKSLTFKSLSNYYKRIENFQKVSYYDSLHSEILHDRSESVKQTSNELLSEMRVSEELEKRNSHILLAILVFSLIFIVFLIIFYRLRQNKERVQYKKALEKIKAQESAIEKQTIATTSNAKNSNRSIMTEETENRLLYELQEMEKTKFFLQKEVSLSALASELNSNPKYVSNIINTHKQKDFNNYVNELRIQYILEKFQNDPQYLKYKLAFIAEECGFSSHSKFAAIFKSYTGLSPSVFVRQLKKDQKELVEI